MRGQWKTVVVAGAVLALGVGYMLDDLRAQAPAGATGGHGGVAVVDIVKVFNDFRQTQDVNAEFETRRREVRTEVSGRDSDLQTRTRELEAFDPDSPDYRKRRRELLRQRIDRDVYMRLAEVEVRDLFRLWTGKTYEQICATVQAVAEERGFEVVVIREELEPDIDDANTLKQQIRLRKVIYSHPRVDLTEEVLSRLNRAYEQQNKKPDLGLIGT